MPASRLRNRLRNRLEVEKRRSVDGTVLQVRFAGVELVPGEIE